MSFLLHAGCFLLALTASPGFLQDKKTPAPDASAQKEAEKLIRDVFKDDYAKKSPADRTALARKLLQQAEETKDDAASRYVLLRESRDLAGQSGDLDLALQAAGRMSSEFEGDPVAMKSALLAGAARSAKTPEEFQKLARAYLALVDDATAVEQYEAAEKAAEQAAAQARKGKDLPTASKADARMKVLSDRKARFEKVKKARDVLAAKPEDPAANLAVGLYECLLRGNWEAGLPLLAKGGDPVYKSIAERETATPAGLPEEVALADSWWEQADKEKDPAIKDGLLKRSRFWYRHAFPGLTGLVKAKVEKRMGDLVLEQFGGVWVDISDPKGYGQQARPGEPLQLTPKTGSFMKATLDKMPAGDFDALSVRIRHKPDSGASGVVFYESDFVAGVFDPALGKYQSLRQGADLKSWDREAEVAAEAGREYTVTVVNAGGEYIHYLDGKEMVRQKAKLSKIFRVAFQAERETVTFDQIRLRRKE